MFDFRSKLTKFRCSPLSELQSSAERDKEVYDHHEQNDKPSVLRGHLLVGFLQRQVFPRVYGRHLASDFR